MDHWKLHFTVVRLRPLILTCILCAAEFLRAHPSIFYHHFFSTQSCARAGEVAETYCSCLWVKAVLSQSHIGRQTTTLNHSTTYGQLRVYISAAFSLDCGKERRAWRESTQAQGEHANFHEKGLKAWHLTCDRPALRCEPLRHCVTLNSSSEANSAWSHRRNKASLNLFMYCAEEMYCEKHQSKFSNFWKL